MPRAALTVAEIFRRYGDTFRAEVGAALSTAQRRVMTAIEQCRTAALGGHVEQCDHCGHRRVWYNSCRNRHCPTCQSLARAAWLEQRRADLLPTEYFHVVFTVPPAVAEIAAQNKAAVYGLLFRAVAETLRTIAADPRHLGAEIGFFAVLHTWGQTLVHHPHLHCVIPGGGLASDSSGWVACRPGFFLPVRNGASRRKTMTLAATEFIRRMLLHVLPPGFHRIRYYGFLANRNRQQKLTECRRSLRTPPPAEQAGPVATDYRDRCEALTGRSLRRCPRCHDGNMQAVDHLSQFPATPGRTTCVSDPSRRRRDGLPDHPSPSAVRRQPTCNAVWNARQLRLPTMQRP